MHILTPITALIGALLAHPAAAFPADLSLAQADTSPALPSPLDKRDNAIFTLGAALCTSGTPSRTREDSFSWPGQYDVGCNEHDRSQVWGSVLQAKNAFSMIVCGVKTNFYYKNGNWDFYQDSSDGTLLGTCYPHQGPYRYCLIPLGSCSVSAKYYCYYSNRGRKLCN
ncbi:hypothetical protein ACHAQA_006606 [Verticillium albo-atrum]